MIFCQWVKKQWNGGGGAGAILYLSLGTLMWTTLLSDRQLISSPAICSIVLESCPFALLAQANGWLPPISRQNTWTAKANKSVSFVKVGKGAFFNVTSPQTFFWISGAKYSANPTSQRYIFLSVIKWYESVSTSVTLYTSLSCSFKLIRIHHFFFAANNIISISDLNTNSCNSTSVWIIYSWFCYHIGIIFICPDCFYRWISCSRLRSRARAFN